MLRVTPHEGEYLMQHIKQLSFLEASISVERHNTFMKYTFFLSGVRLTSYRLEGISRLMTNAGFVLTSNEVHIWFNNRVAYENQNQDGFVGR